MPAPKSTPFEMLHRDPLQLAIRLALLDVITLIELRLPLPHAKQHLDLPLLPIEREWKKRMPFLSRIAFQLQDFTFVQQQLPNGFREVIEAVAEGILVDVGVVQVGFTTLDTNKSVADLRLAGTKRLDLCPMQHDPTLISVQDVIIATSLRIGDDISHETIGLFNFQRKSRGEQSLDRKQDPGSPTELDSAPIKNPGRALNTSSVAVCNRSTRGALALLAGHIL